MKKFLRITAALAAVFAMVNFVACKDDDDDGGDEGTGFENTYWVQEDVVVGEEDPLTFVAVSYVHIKDGTTGTIYQTSDDTLDSAVEELITAAETGSKEVAYDENSNLDFTYAIEGSAIKITYKDETGADVSLNVTVAADKNSLSYTDDEGDTLTFKKAAEAPKAAKVTYTVKTADPATKVLAVTYDLTNGLPADFPTSDTLVSADWAAPTATPAENDVTWTWVATTNRKVKSNTGMQVSNGTSAEDMISLKADSDFTVKITYKFAGTYAAEKIRCLTINGEAVHSMTETTDKDQTYTYTTTAAKSVTIGANGMKLTKIETSPAE